MNIDLIKRPSARGIKKCKDCGLFNGQKAQSCKNEKCRSYKTKTKVKNPRNASAKAVKLHSNGESTYYSVKVKDKGPDIRSFVKITDKFLAENVISRSAICFVDACKNQDGIVNCHHIQNINDDLETSIRLSIDKSVLDTMKNISSDTKSRIWNEYLKKPDPACQRVSKYMFVVSGESAGKAADGLEHVQIDETKFSCSCKVQRPPCDHILTAFTAILSSEMVKNDFSDMLKSQYCEPFLSKTSNEINEFEIQNEAIIFQAGEDFLLNDNPFEQSEERTELAVNDIYEDFELMEDCQIELMDQFNLTDRIDLCPSDIEITDDNLLLNNDNLIFSAIESCEDENEMGQVLELEVGDDFRELVTENGLKTVNKNCDNVLKHGSYNVRKMLKVLESNGIVLNKLKHTGRGGPSLEADFCQLNFNQWLEFVIEKMNSVIDYNNNDGKPKTIIFDVQHNFFNCLNSRFSVGHTRRLPKETIPLDNGLTQFVYKFTHYKSLVNVFKTDKVQLAFVKNFTRNSNGFFEELHENLNTLPMIHLEKQGKHQKITPKIYKTFIKLGTYKAEPEKNYEFIIKWVPNIHKISKFGEMQITFEFGLKSYNEKYEIPINTQEIGHSIITITENL